MDKDCHSCVIQSEELLIKNYKLTDEITVLKIKINELNNRIKELGG